MIFHDVFKKFLDALCESWEYNDGFIGKRECLNGENNMFFKVKI